MELKICHLYPDVLNFNGDGGNLLCLRKRLEWRGIDCSITELPLGADADLTQFDLFYIGGGEDCALDLLLSDLAGGKAAQLREAVEAGKVFLAVCCGYQLMGKSLRTLDGTTHELIGAVDMHTEAYTERLTGNCMFRCAAECSESPVIGFENHSGRTHLGEGVSPLGMVLAGHGNNGEDGTEGCRYRNVFGSYSHGPLLPKNPELADYLLLTALHLRYPDAELSPLDDEYAHRAHAVMEKRLSAAAQN